MAIILRRTKGSTLTHDELDDNFQQLSISNLDSAKVEALIDSAYIQQRVPESYLETIIDSDYVENRVTHRDSAFVTGIVDSAYIIARQTHYLDSDAVKAISVDSAEVINLVDSSYVQARVDSAYVTGIVDSAYFSLIVDSSYIANRSSSGGGLGSIQLITTASSVTKVGDGDVFVELAGGGGGGSTASYLAGHSYGRGVLHNVADGSTITISAIGAGGVPYGVSSGVGGTGGSTTVYVDSANGQKLIMGGGTGAHATSGTGISATTPTASGGATALFGTIEYRAQTEATGLGLVTGPDRASGTQYGYGMGGLYNHGGGAEGYGTPGAVLLIGV